jgi:hypothetical protein
MATFPLLPRRKVGSIFCLGLSLLQMPIKIRPLVGAALTRGRVGELVFQIGQPPVVGPLIGEHADRKRRSPLPPETAR